MPGTVLGAADRGLNELGSLKDDCHHQLTSAFPIANSSVWILSCHSEGAVYFFWNIVSFNFYLLSLFEVLGNAQDWRMCLSGRAHS